VSSAHEKIDGYMEAMTMSFEPRRADQLAAVSVGDKVSFSDTSANAPSTFVRTRTRFVSG
jgi:Cu/Ag efflux protein CusF